MYVIDAIDWRGFVGAGAVVRAVPRGRGRHAKPATEALYWRYLDLLACGGSHQMSEARGARHRVPVVSPMLATGAFGRLQQTGG